MRSSFLFIGVLSALLLSGCHGSPAWMKNPFNKEHYSSARSSVDVRMREDNGMTKMPPAVGATHDAANTTSMNSHVQAMGNSSVEIFDISGGALAHGGGMMVPTMPSYNMTGVTSRDSSVTIFPIDGSAPMMGGQPAYGYNAGGYSGNYSHGGDNQIFFKHGSSRLGGGDKRKLSSVAEQAKFAPVNRVTVAGHASPPTQAGSNTVEGHILNLKESMNRTFAVSKELMKKGVPAEKIKSVSWGATKPTGNNTQDRRVDIIMGEQ